MFGVVTQPPRRATRAISAPNFRWLSIPPTCSSTAFENTQSNDRSPNGRQHPSASIRRTCGRVCRSGEGSKFTTVTSRNAWYNGKNSESIPVLPPTSNKVFLSRFAVSEKNRSSFSWRRRLWIGRPSRITTARSGPVHDCECWSTEGCPIPPTSALTLRPRIQLLSHPTCLPPEPHVDLPRAEFLSSPHSQ